jgi:D-amino-acid dehydrogenase
VVVVGAGIAGACVALGLARRGATTTVVDAARDGRATAAGAGIIAPWATTADGPFYDLYARGAAFYPTIVDQLAELGVGDVGYRRCGALVVADGRAEVDAAEGRISTRLAHAPEIGTVERLSGDGLRQRFPPLRDGLHGLFLSGGARVDGRLIVAGLLDAVRRLGGTVREGEVAVRPAAGTLAVEVDGGRVDADLVAVAGGAWTRPLLAPLGVAVDVEPQRGQIVHLRLDGTDTGAWPTVLPMADHYLVAFEGGRIVAGATRETGSGFDPRVTAGGLADVLAAAIALAPDLAGASFVEARVGLRPLAMGGMPTVGPLPGHDGAFVATGYGQAGLTMAPVLGDALAELMLTGTAPFALPTPD